jgi:hypothetical protein
MEEFSRHRERKAVWFLLVCAIHGALGWFLLAAGRFMTLHAQARSFELLVLPPTQVPVPTAATDKQRSAVPRNINRPPRRIVNQEKATEPSIQTNEITPPVDWNAELVQAARAAVGNGAKIPIKNFGFPTRSPTIKDYPQFDWDYARTHRVESLPEGGIIINLNDNCVLVLNPFPFLLCSPLKRKANGELFKHMRDPDQPGDAGVPR